MTHEKRRARRVLLNVPTLIRTLAPDPSDGAFDPEQRSERSRSIAERACEFPATVRDISINGAFIAGQVLPLLTRVSFRFELRGYGTIDAHGRAMWCRDSDARAISGDDRGLLLPRGFGVLFEAISLDDRAAIHNFVLNAQ
ncbi:MAG: hypothetical protein Tsb0020_17720 [Haliangiales bacterium]